MSSPTRTVVLTGANGTMALSFAKLALEKYTDCALVLTVRNPTKSDPNTQKLQKIIAAHPNAPATLHTLDLASLESVKAFSTDINSKVKAGTLPPISAIVCNAFAWSINGGQRLTQDGYELSFQVNHLSHFALTLQLLGSMNKQDGRIIYLSSDAHFNPTKNPLTVYPVGFPTAGQEESLIKPPADKAGEVVGRGFQRYALSKLCVVMAAYSLNKHFAADPDFKNLTAIAMDPGGMPDSRCMDKGVPKMWTYLMKYVLGPLTPVLNMALPTLRKSGSAAKDLVELSVGPTYAGKTGYYTMINPDKSTEEAYDENKQEILWKKSLEWAHLNPEDTPLKGTF